MENLERLCIHSITTKPWSLAECVENFSQNGVRGITIWKEQLAGLPLAAVRSLLKDCGMQVVSLCRGGFFVAPSAAVREKALDANRRDIELAFEIGAPLVVLVCGADPRVRLGEARKQIAGALAQLLPEAQAAGVSLAVEPLHPMYADARSAINTLKQANDICDALQSDFLGVAVDVYHLWWDSELREQITRCGAAGYLKAFHICDWGTPTKDFLNDRELMGRGCIPIAEIRSWVEAAGFTGFEEVEIFSEKYWAQDQKQFLQEIIGAYKAI